MLEGVAGESISQLPSQLVVSALGMNLHAATMVDGRDRRRLERLCKHLVRPPFSQDAVPACAAVCPTHVAPSAHSIVSTTVSAG